jgi:hypothetical protein
LQVCYPDAIGSDTGKRSKGNGCARFKIKDIKISIDVARQALQEVGLTVTTSSYYNLEKTIKATIRSQAKNKK